MRSNANVTEFAAWGEVAETTTQLLALDLRLHAQRRPGAARGTANDDPVKHLVLQQARDYLALVREGFVLSVRTNQVQDASEIRYLLERVLTDWTELSRELGIDDEQSGPADLMDGREPAEVERVRNQLLAFGMAAVALGYLPRLPAEQVTFPYSYGEPPTYADITPPDSPGEMYARIEELEQMVWKVMAADLQELIRRHYGPLRRTYGFFESSAHLTRRETKRFGIRRRATGF